MIARTLAIAALVLMSGCGGGAAPAPPAQPRVALRVLELAPAGAERLRARVALANGTATSAPLSPAHFTLELASGAARGQRAGSAEACAGAVAPGADTTCDVEFTVAEGATPLRVRWADGARVALAAVPARKALARCLLFADTLDPACFEACALGACAPEQDDAEGACAQACLVSCAGDDDPCTCAAAGCGPDCAGALAAYDTCANPCVLLCREPS